MKKLIKKLLREGLNEADYPLENPPMYGDSDYKSRNGKIIMKSPQFFLSLVPHLEFDDESEENIEILADKIAQGETIDPPTLYVDGDRVDNHDGRHRVYAAMRSDIQLIPVLFIDVNNKEPWTNNLKKQEG